MVPEAGFCIHKVLRVNQKLVFRCHQKHCFETCLLPRSGAALVTSRFWREEALLDKH